MTLTDTELDELWNKSKHTPLICTECSELNELKATKCCWCGKTTLRKITRQEFDQRKGIIRDGQPKTQTTINDYQQL